MKMRNRCSSPDSPHPGDEHPSDWITKPYSIVFTAVVLFILIFGIAIFQGWRQFETARHNILAADKTTANLLADLILEYNRATIGILQSYAHRPLFIDAVKNKDLAGVHRHLSDLKKNAEIDLTFMTDTRGILWANFPVFPEAIGKDLSNRDWYKGISTHWKPYISTVFKLIVGDKPLAVAVCVPIFDEKERAIGILASSERLGFLADAIQKVSFSPYTTMNVIDRAGKILYSNKVPYQESITDCRLFPIIEPAVKEKKQQIEINDPQKDQEKLYLTVVPVGDIGWTVIIARSLRDIYRSDLHRFIEIGAVSFLLFLLIIFFYLRKAILFRKTEELLHAEIKLRQSEENFHHSLDDLPLGVRIVTEEGETIYANRAILDIYGYDSVEELTTTPVKNRYTPQSYTEFKIRREKRKGDVDVPPEYTINIIRKDGEVRHLLVLRREILWDGERQFQVLYNDITERKRAEVALRESEERYRTILENIEDGYFEVDIAGNLTFFNDSVCRMTGYTHAEMMGMNNRQYTDNENSQILYQTFNKVFRTGEPSKGIDYEIIRKDGTKLYIQSSVSLIRNISGQPIGFRGIMRNITERKRAEEALRESEKKYRELVNLLPQIVYETDEHANFTFVNQTSCSLTGYTQDDLKGLNALQMVAPIDRDRVKNNILKVLQGETITGNEYLMQRKDGSTFSAIFHSIPIIKENKIVGFRGFAVDITERKRAEEALSARERSYRALAENLPGIVYRVHICEKNRMQFFNNMLVTLTGYNEKELIEGEVCSIDPLIVAEDQDRVIAEVKAAIKDNRGFSVEYRITHKDGTSRFFVEQGRPIFGNDELNCIDGIILDITEQKRVEEELRESKEKYRNLVENANEGIFVAQDSKLVFFNPMTAMIAGYSSEELTEKPFIEFIHPDDRDMVIARNIRRIKGEELPHIYPFRIIRRDGNIRWVELNTILINWKGKKATLNFLSDITERKQAEEKLRASQQQLRALAVHLQQIREEERIMISREIHDVMGGGLTGLKMDLSWLMNKVEKAESDKEQAAFMSRVLTSSETIDHMIKVTRSISTGLRPPVLDDLGLIAALEWQLSDFTNRTEIPHELATAFEYVSMEEASAVAVFRIFQEVLTNVMRHSGATKVVVVLREDERSLFGDENLVLEIRDNGRGITEEEILKPESLGLLGMKERALAFGGELSIRGEPGGGTVVVLKIPRKRGEPS